MGDAVMSSPLRSASGWSRVAQLGVLALATVTGCWGQFSVTLSPLHPSIPAAYLGKPLPKGLSVALANTCNEGGTSAAIYVDRIAQACSTVAAVQDGEAARYAAQAAKASNWKVLGLSILEVALPIGAGISFGAASSLLAKGLAAAGGAAVITERVRDRKAELGRLDLPANWWTPNPTLQTSLAPGQCYPLLLAISGPLAANSVTIAAVFESTTEKVAAVFESTTEKVATLKTTTHPDEIATAEQEGREYAARITVAVAERRERESRAGVSQ